MAKVLSESAAAPIRQTIDKVTSDKKGIPGTVFVAVNRQGEVIFSHASGTRGVDSSEPMTLDTVFWIASCTKMITGVAAMQLVEQGKLALDDADLVEKLAPELKDIKILADVDDQGKPKFVDKKNRITLRLLLSHTAGFGYTFFDDKLRRWGQPVGVDEFSGHPKDVLSQPLLFEPGTAWEYGVGIDWAGTLIERVSGLSLNEYFQKHIFQPLNLKHINMFPTQEMIGHLAYMHARERDGTLRGRDHLHRRALIVDGDDIAKTFNSGGAGCFAKPREYCEILATLLNDGTSPTTGATILQPQTVHAMFQNSIPKFPNFGRQPIPDAKPDLTNPIPQLYPQPPEQPQGWGLTFMITIEPAATGRGRNTGWWAGLPNLFWWCDREKGVAGIIASQILPFADPQVLGLWAQVEGALYAAQ